MEIITTFKDLNLSEPTAKAIEAMGFETPSPIQAKTIPSILAGRDVIGQAQTGTGKTAAFAIPTIEKLDQNIRSPQAVILCPTRELAVQVAGEFDKLLKFQPNMRVVAIYGGQDIERQFTALRRGVQIIIATPGRLQDHLDRKTINLDTVKIVVLDEADEMLDRGFKDDIEAIFSKIPTPRQTVFFSATMSKEILNLTKKYQTDPLMLKVEDTLQNKPKIEQVYFEVTERTKFDTLSRILDVNNHKLSLIFCRTKNRVNDVVERLQERGYLSDGLHGDMRQSKRDLVMAQFRKGKIEILVATDVAARGLDIENVEAVYNYDMPHTTEYCTHRIGRTGRAGKEGVAVALIAGGDVYALKDIVRNGKFIILRKDIPSEQDAAASKLNAMGKRIQEIIAEGELERYNDMIQTLINNEAMDAKSLSAALLKIAFGHDKVAPQATVKEFDSRVERNSSRPPRTFSRGREEGGRRPFRNDRSESSGDRPSWSSDRPARPAGDRPAYSSDRPQRSSGDRPAWSSDRPARPAGDRPSFSSDRPARPAGDRPGYSSEGQHRSGERPDRSSSKPRGSGSSFGGFKKTIHSA